MIFDMEKNDISNIKQTNSGTMSFIKVRKKLHLMRNFTETEYVLIKLKMKSKAHGYSVCE